MYNFNTEFKRIDMLRLKNFLTEKIVLTEAALSSSVSSDDKGKLHELLLAKHLHPAGTLPEHHRSESENEDHAGTPQQVHDRLKKKIGDAAYNEIDAHSKDTAKALLKHLTKEGHLGNGVNVGNVHWTSNPDKATKAGDHEKTTGIKDVNSNADLIMTLHKDGKVVGHHGVSAKYGTNKEPNYRNPGLDSLEKTAGLSSGTLNGLMKNHHANMETIGYHGSAEDRHAQWKVDKMGIDKARAEHARLTGLVATDRKLSAKEKNLHKHLEMFVNAHDQAKDKEHFAQHSATRASQAEASALVGKQAVAKKFAEAIGTKSDQELRKLVTDHVSAPTHIPHTVAHSHVQSDGSSKAVVKPSDSIASEHLKNYENLHVVHQGISAVIRGTHKETGKISRVATMTMKGSSGPHRGVVGTFGLK